MKEEGNFVTVFLKNRIRHFLKIGVLGMMRMCFVEPVNVKNLLFLKLEKINFKIRFFPPV